MLSVPLHIPEWLWEYMTPYQRKGVSRALWQHRLIFNWPTGSGKTLGALAWLLGLQAKKILVVTKAGLIPQWRRQMFRYTPSLEAGIEFHSWESLTGGYETFNQKWDAIVFDELHKGKNHKRWNRTFNKAGKLHFTRSLNNSAVAAHVSRQSPAILGLTATLIQDRAIDLWSQLDIVVPDAVGGRKYWDWVEEFCHIEQGQYGRQIMGFKAEKADEWAELQAIYIHQVSQSEAHGALPPLRRTKVLLGPEEQNHPGSWATDLRRAMKGGGISLLEAQLCQAAAKKRRWLLALIREAFENKQKIVVLTGRRKEADELGQLLIEGLKDPLASVRVVHGEKTPEERDIRIREYMAAEGFAALIATGDSVGEGIDLQDTDIAIMAMLPWTPGRLIQWEGRFSRLGQKRPCEIIYPIATGTADDYVANKILSKIPDLETTVGLGSLVGWKEIMQGTDEEILQQLVTALTTDAA